MGMTKRKLRLIYGVFFLIILAVTLPFVFAGTQLFFENWEDNNMNDWSNTGWALATDQKIGNYAVKCAETVTCDMNSVASADTSSASTINVSFQYFDDDCDIGDVIWYWNDTDGNWDEIGNIDGGTLSGDDNWYYHSVQSNDAQYKHTGFSVKFSATPETGAGPNGENYWVDNINISCIEAPANTCTYDTGNWDVLCSDNCNITDVTSLPNNNLTLSGTGTFTILANITVGMIIMDTNCQVINLAGDNKKLMVV